MLHRLALLWLFLLPFGWALAGDVPLPPPGQRVTDLTGTLSASEQSELSNRLAALEQAKGSQVVIVLLPSTQPESIEQFGIRLAEAWKIGRQKIDDGVIVIVAKDDRRMRIEVGYGLEGAIPDAIAKRIIDEQMAPHFRNGDFYGGLRSTVDTLEKLIGGETLPPPSPRSEKSFDSDTLVFIVIFLAGLARSLFGLAGALAVSALAGWLAWSAFGSLIAAGIAALLAFFFSFARTGRGGWHTGGSGGFSSRGGGGFSGGGGGFGGGGASGRW